jgi:DNA (cytosine-5)-methyltransferase 1
VAFCENDSFPSSVLRYRYPDVPNLGDLTEFRKWTPFEIDLLVGGTPCQSFSIAGKRQGMDDTRGQLLLSYLGVVVRYRPRWLVWENVPGVLSSHGGRDFGAFLGSLAKLGYGFAYRVLDAQYFGVPQRRRRVFVVGCLGDWRRAAAVLFERHSLRGDSPPSRGAGAGVAGDTAPGIIAFDGQNLIVNNETSAALDTTGDKYNRGMHVAYMPTRTFGADGGVNEIFAEREVADALHTSSGNGNKAPIIRSRMRVRRLTPRECERLQGFPDDYTLVPAKHAKLAADCPRYKALGNTMAVPVMRWIGERIQRVVNHGRT